MHLVYKALEKYAIPNALPPELMPPGKRKDIMPESKSPVPPIVGPPPIPPLPNVSAVNSLAGLDTKVFFIYINNSVIRVSIDKGVINLLSLRGSGYIESSCIFY